jgi:predicted acyltransferase
MTLGDVADQEAGSPRPRYLALDVFRGATVCVMIVVNTPGPAPHPFPWLAHADWFGFTVTDLVFPSFLFAVGNAMSFTVKRTRHERAFLLKTAKRTALIFLLGYLMFWYPFVHYGQDGHLVGTPLATVRIMGVLQRIAVCFGLASLAARYLSERSAALLCLLLLFGYWALLLVFGDPGAQLTPFGNAGARLDRAVLGPQHMYRGGARGYDPEGLLSTLPAIVNVLAGYLAGRWLARGQDKRRAVLVLAGAGVALLAAALIWAPWFPIGKRIWTSSFAVLAVGLDLVLLAGLIAYIDLAGARFGVRFFEVFGKNPLVIYLFSEMFILTLQLFRLRGGQNPYDFVGETVFQTIAPGAIGSLACALSYMLICWCLGYLLDRKGMVIKI